MTSLVPRPPYSPEELERLYPKDLELQLVQILLRHGERSPVTARFQNACFLRAKFSCGLLLIMPRPVSLHIGRTAMLPGA
jgi:hypothetical protein